MKRQSFLKNTIISSSGFFVLTLFNFIFNSFAARYLAPENYAIYTSFFYFLLSFSQIINAIRLTISKEIIENKIHKNIAIISILYSLKNYIIFLFILFLVLSYPLKTIFKLPSLFSVFIGFAILVFWILLNSLKGMYQSLLSFYKYSFISIFDGFFRCIIGILLIYIGLNVNGALLSSFLSSFMIISFIILKNIQHINKSNIKKFDNFFEKIKYSILTLVPLGLLIQIDLTLVQYFIGGKEAGYVSACVIFGKSLILLALEISNVAFTHTIYKDKNALIKGLILISALFLSAFLFVLVFNRLIVNIIFGDNYLPMMKIFPYYIISMTPVAILQLFINYGITKESRSIPYFVWFFLILTIILQSVYLKNFKNLSQFFIYNTVIYFIYNIIFYLKFLVLKNELKGSN